LKFSAPRKRDHIRIVSSTATDAEDALGDLLDEAESLPLTAAGLPGEKTTTLLVCSWPATVKLARKTHVQSRKSLKSSGSTFAFVGVHFGVLEGSSRIKKTVCKLM